MANPPLDKALTPSSDPVTPSSDPKLVQAAASPPRSFLATLPGGGCCQRGATFPTGRDHTHDNTLPLAGEARKSTDPGSVSEKH